MPSMNRSRRSNTGSVGLIEQENEAYSRSTSSSSNPVASAFEARRRRKYKSGSDNNNNNNNNNSTDHKYPSSSDYDPADDDNNNGRMTRKGSRISRRFNSSKNSDTNGKSGTKELPKKEADPYDSDPGESYREHCERIEEQHSRSCLVLPRFLNGNRLFLGGRPNSAQVGNASSAGAGHSSSLTAKVGSGPLRSVDDVSGATSPPSPLLSEPGDGHTPASLPHDLARVRYSLRTSIGDGADVQPGGGSAALMDRRELRPNNVHINVSHWSDFGGRNYMEDR